MHAEFLSKPSPTSGPSSPSPQAPSPHAHSTSPSAKFHFLKKSTNRRATSGSDDYFDARSSPASASTSTPNGGASSSSTSSSGSTFVPDHVVRQLSTALATLKAQHAELLLTLSQHSSSHLHSHPHSHSHHSSFDSLPRASTPLRTYASRSSAGFPIRNSGSRASSIVSMEGSEEYYEPEDMPGEFFLDEEDEEAVGSSGSAEEDEEEEEEEEEEVESFSSLEDGEEDRSRGRERQGESEMTTRPEDVKRRHAMPFETAGDEFSMLGMLRKNVGKVSPSPLTFSYSPLLSSRLTPTHTSKDLSTISFPVTMNEPLSGLQRVAEDFEYADLLHRAAATDDPMDRLALVATFAVSGASSNKFRSSRKPLFVSPPFHPL